MLDHMSSSGVMHGDGGWRGDREGEHEVKRKNIAAVHVRYRDTHGEEEAGYNNVTNQDRSTTSQICLSWWLCWIRGAMTTRLEVHGHGEEEVGYKMRGARGGSGVQGMNQ